jgi:hypothetical protein
MLFSVQAYIEDYLNKLNIRDTDAYAVRLANKYFYERNDIPKQEFLKKVRRIRTVIFINNKVKNRGEFEEALISKLDKRFKKKLRLSNHTFPGGIAKERTKFKSIHRKTIKTIITEFVSAVEARAIDGFWRSRTSNKLRTRPEKIAQTLFAVFVKGVLRKNGLILREMASGPGFVDISVILSKTLHLIEIKVLRNSFSGPEQLDQYMKYESRNKGSLLIFDAHPPELKINLPDIIPVKHGIIKLYRADINPPIPSKLRIK